MCYIYNAHKQSIKSPLDNYAGNRSVNIFAGGIFLRVLIEHIIKQAGEHSLYCQANKENEEQNFIVKSKGENYSKKLPSSSPIRPAVTISISIRTTVPPSEVIILRY